MRSICYFLLSIAGLNLLPSCGKRVMSDASEYMKYLADPRNGLIKEKKIGGLQYRVKYLPAEYLAYTILKDHSEINNKDSVVKLYHNSLTILLTVGPAPGEEFDITRVDVSNYSEFADRIEELAFEQQSQISLVTDGKTVKPELVRLENMNSIENARNFVVVFNRTTVGDILEKDFCFEFDDQLFYSGYNKFRFAADDISNTPTLNF